MAAMSADSTAGKAVCLRRETEPGAPRLALPRATQNRRRHRIWRRDPAGAQGRHVQGQPQRKPPSLGQCLRLGLAGGKQRRAPRWPRRSLSLIHI
eukprot:90323-Alexandrium_andersonii.AAC.1